MTKCINSFQFNNNEYGELWKSDNIYHLYYWGNHDHDINKCDYSFTSAIFKDILEELKSWQYWIIGGDIK